MQQNIIIKKPFKLKKNELAKKILCYFSAMLHRIML